MPTLPSTVVELLQAIVSDLQLLLEDLLLQPAIPVSAVQACPLKSKASTADSSFTPKMIDNAFGGANHIQTYDPTSGPNGVNAANLALFQSVVQSIPRIASAKYLTDEYGFIYNPAETLPSVQEQCVALVAALTGVSGNPNNWPSVTENVAANILSIAPGTPIATFPGPGEPYTEAQGHAAVFLSAGQQGNTSGMYILDQYNIPQIKSESEGAPSADLRDLTEYSPAEIRFYPSTRSDYHEYYVIPTSN